MSWAKSVLRDRWRAGKPLSMSVRRNQRPPPGEQIYWAVIALKYMRWRSRDVYYTWSVTNHSTNTYGTTPRQALCDHFGVLVEGNPALLQMMDDISVRKYVPGRPV